MTSYDVRVIERQADLVQLAPEWDRIADEGRPNPFARPDWHLPWMASFGRELSLRVLVARDPLGRLHGVLPLHREANGKLSLLCDPHTPEAGASIRAGHEDAVLTAMLSQLGSGERRRPALTVCCLNGDAPFTRSLHRVLADDRRMLTAIEPLAGSWSTDVSGSLDTFLAGRSRNFRRTVRRALRAGVQAGLEVERVTTPERLQAVLPQLAAISLQSWQARRASGAFAAPLDFAFYSEVAQRFAARGRLLLHVARANGSPVAYRLHLVDGDRMDALKSEFDPGWAEARPGWTLTAAAYRDAFERGVTRIELGTWTTPFKRRWATRRTSYHRVRVHPRTISGIAQYVLPAAKSLARRATRGV